MVERDAHLALLRKLIDVIWNARALDRLPEVFTEHAAIHYGPHDLKGYSQIADDFMGPLQAAFPDLHHTIEDLFVIGDRGCMRYHGTGTHQGAYDGHAPTRRPLAYDGIAIFRFEAGRIAEIWSYSDFGPRFAELQWPSKLA